MNYIELFTTRVQKLRTLSNGQVLGLCPFHDDVTPSWSGNPATGLWQCFGCGKKGNARQFAEALGVHWENPAADKAPKPHDPWKESKIVSTYDYLDEQGSLLYQVVRFDPKDFRQRRPDSSGWINNATGVQRVLYRLPDIQGAVRVFFCEGEKDVESLRAHGLAATTIAGGVEGPLTSEMLKPLIGKSIVILPDNDEPGKRFASKVATMLKQIGIDPITLALPELPPKEDIAWWLANGHAPAELEALILAASDDLVLVPYSQIEEKKIDWLWYPYIPIGRITILEGDPEQGKTWFSLSVATSVTLGGWWFSMPEEDSLMEPSAVLHMQCEDDPEDTVKRRLRILQTDQDKLILMKGRRHNGPEGTLRVTMDDIPRLAKAIDRTKAKLVIIDPIQAYMPKGLDPNKANDVRPLMMSLQGLAKQKQCAILLIRHFAKGSKDRAMYKGSGSIDWTAAARSVLMAAKRKDEATGKFQFCIAQVKNNICAHGPTLIFEINQGNYEWVGTSDLSPEDMVAPAQGEQKSNGSTQEGVRFLLNLLHGGKELSWEDILRQGRKSHLSEDALRIAALQSRLKQRIEEGTTFFSSPYRQH